MARRGRGEGSIYKRQDGRYTASITVEGRIRKYFYGKTRKEVQDKLQQALYEHQQGLLLTDPQTTWTVEQYLTYWLEEVHRLTIRDSTCCMYRCYLQAHLLPHLGPLPLKKLTAQHVQRLYTCLQRDKGLSAGAIRFVHSILKGALKHAVAQRFLHRNVCEQVSVPRLTRRAIQPLDPEQARHLLEVSQTSEHALSALLTLAVASGMRLGELLALRWRDVQLKDRRLQVRQSVGYIPGMGFVENEPKTKAGRRTIDLPAFVIQVLQEHRLRQVERRLQAGARWQERDLVFCNQEGGFLHPATTRKRFKRVLQEAGLPAVRFHDLRHSAATILLSIGVPLKVVQELLGHSNGSTTLNVYSHVLPSMQRAAMDQLDALYALHS